MPRNTQSSCFRGLPPGSEAARASRQLGERPVPAPRAFHSHRKRKNIVNRGQDSKETDNAEKGGRRKTHAPGKYSPGPSPTGTRGL